jgi:DNA processing protein
VSETSRLLSPTDAGYPAGLSDLEEPPVIYVRGKIPSGPMVAIVGTRKCTRYGLDLAVGCGRLLADIGCVVVSGLARGIDGAAHRGTVLGGGLGVAILGSGLGHVYPAENKPLLGQLLDLGGAVVSEYPDETPPDRWRFPARNRLIAAMSEAVVVVESALTGGSQITAVLAAEIGRPVFAFPGDVDRPASVGTNRLIRDGAIPVLGAEDLVSELALLSAFQGHGRSGDGTAIPETGIALEDLPSLWDCTIVEALARVGAGEATGRFRRDGDRVFGLTAHTEPTRIASSGDESSPSPSVGL